MPVRAVLRRLAIPVVLLAAFIAATVAADRFGNDEVGDREDTVTTAGAETPVFSVRRAPELLTSPRAAEELTESLDDWVETLPENSCFVVSAGGERLYEHQPDLPLTPASNMKILTAVAALEALGPDFRFETRIAALERPDENGLLVGDLYVIGGGDPLLMTDAYRATLPDGTSPVFTSADTLADQTIATNLADIQGAVVVVENRYDTERAPAGTPQSFLDSGLLGSLSAAMIDRGFVGFKEGYPGQGGDNPSPLPRAADPASEFAAVFDDLLEARNVRISSRSRVELEPPTGQLAELLVYQSPPLSEIVQQMLVDSDNTTAEMLVKELGFITPTTNSGSTTSGLLELTAQLNNLGLPGSAAFAFDGSGMNAETKVSCNLVHDALNVTAHKATLRDALPVAGESGTLANRFRGTKGEGSLRAKTGLLANAASLSGYFVTDPGVELTFSLIINTGPEDPAITAEQVNGWQRPLPRLLAPYPSGPALDALGPVGVDLSSVATAPTPEPTDGAGGSEPSEVEPSGADTGDGGEGSDGTGADSTADGN